VLTLRRITALAILASLLALPVLSVARADACCAGDSPCAPAGGPCQSVGPIPCCAGGHGSSAASESRASAPVFACAALASRPLEVERALRGAFERPSPAAPSSALRLSVVLRI
jgi:hypothetical protein